MVDLALFFLHIWGRAGENGLAMVLQGVYKEELQEHFGIVFNNLFCLNNMPIKRYVDYLQRRNKLEEYMQVN